MTSKIHSARCSNDLFTCYRNLWTQPISLARSPNLSAGFLVGEGKNAHNNSGFQAK